MELSVYKAILRLYALRPILEAWEGYAAGHRQSCGRRTPTVLLPKAKTKRSAEHKSDSDIAPHTQRCESAKVPRRDEGNGHCVPNEDPLDFVCPCFPHILGNLIDKKRDVACHVQDHLTL